MKLKEATAVFGNKRKIAKLLDLQPSSVGRWDTKRIPMEWAWKLHLRSCGKLPFDPTAYNK